MKKYCILISFLFSYLSSSGQVLQLSEEQSYYQAGKLLKIYEDPESKLTFEQISAPGFADKFTQSTSENPSFGTTHSTFWAKFEIDISEELIRENKWLVNLETAEVGEAELFRVSPDGRLVKQKISAFEPFDKRPIQHRFYIFPVKPAPGKNVFYLKVKFDFLTSIPLSVSTSDDLLSNDHNEQIIFGILYGMLLVMVLYNLFLFFFLREKMYLQYSLYILLYTLGQMQGTNFGFEYLWNSAPEWNRMSLLVLIAASQITSVYFAKAYLNIKKYLPKSKYVFSFVVWVTGLWGAAALIAYYGFGIYIGQAGIMLAAAVYMFVLIIVPALIIRKGYTPAIFFLIAWLFVVAGGQISFFRQTGLLPINTFTNHAGLVGFVLETVLLAFGLAYKINLMREAIKQKEVEKERLKLEEEEKRTALIRKQNEELEGKVEERTKALASANKELHEVNEEVNRQNEEIFQNNEELNAVSEQLQDQNTQVVLKNSELEKQRDEIAGAHRDIQASINYAKRIQLATLPRKEFMKTLFPDHFVLYKPRDTVSGDFYWTTEIIEKVFDPTNALLTKAGRKLKIMVTADCTGHGVPGALMSMIGANLLDQSVKDRKITDPAILLRTMDYSIRMLLKQDTGDNRDGMDAAVISLDEKQKSLQFAGAKRPLVYVKNGELTNLRGTSASVGGESRRNNKAYENHTISYADAPVTLYTFSDGYSDQIGGPENRKFMTKAFRNFLGEIHTLPMEIQEATLAQKLTDWIGSSRQLDDILVIGVHLS